MNLLPLNGEGRKWLIDFLLTSLVFFIVVLEFIVAWSNSVNIISWESWFLFYEGQCLTDTWPETAFNEF